METSVKSALVDLIRPKFANMEIDKVSVVNLFKQCDEFVDYLIENGVTVSVEEIAKETRASTWFIISDECDGHYIQHFCDWHEALLEHLKWCKGNANEEMYKTALSGFDNRDKAIEFCNVILDSEQIIFMAELNGEEFIDNNYFK